MLHEFRCTSCDTSYDEYISGSEPIESECPNCGSIGKKVFTSFSLRVFNDFFSHQTGTMVKSKKDEENELKKLDQKKWETDSKLNGD